MASVIRACENDNYCQDESSRGCRDAITRTPTRIPTSHLNQDRRVSADVIGQTKASPTADYDRAIQVRASNFAGSEFGSAGDLIEIVSLPHDAHRGG
jgi:hypothetical protein